MKVSAYLTATKFLISYTQNLRATLTMIVTNPFSPQKNEGSVVEHSPHHPEVEGLSTTAANGTSREREKSREKYEILSNIILYICIFLGNTLKLP